MAIVALPFLAVFLAALAGLLGWPLALGLMPTLAGWIRWPGLDVGRARRGRRWGLWGYLAMVGLGTMQVGLFWLGLSLEEWDGEKWAVVMIPLVGYTATVGLAAATVVGSVLGCFAGGTKPDRFSWEGSDCEADASASRGVSEARAGARPVTSERRRSCGSRSSKHDRSN